MNRNYTVVIQEVSTGWFKDERGGEGAAQRNSAPDVIELALPFKTALEPTYLIHEATMDGEKVWRSKIETKKADKTLSYKNHFIQLENDTIKVVFPYKKKNEVGHFYVDSTMTYLPEQQGVITLEPGEWAQFLYNERYQNRSEDGHQTQYWKWVINIGLFLELTPSVLVERPPVKVISQLKQIR